MMRDNVVENKLLNQALTVYAKIAGERLIHSGREKEIFALCDSVASKAVSAFMKLALQLVEAAYIPEYIDVVLEFEYQKSVKADISLDELKAIVILKKLTHRLFLEKDLDFFYEIYSHECESAVRDQLSAIVRFPEILEPL